MGKEEATTDFKHQRIPSVGAYFFWLPNQSPLGDTRRAKGVNLDYVVSRRMANSISLDERCVADVKRVTSPLVTYRVTMPSSKEEHTAVGESRPRCKKQR